MSITYNYEIVNVDESAGVMEIIYTADGKPTQHISARLPYEGEDLEAIVEMYSPVAFWQEVDLIKIAPEVGVTGTMTPTVVTVDKADVVRDLRSDLLVKSDKQVIIAYEAGVQVPAEWKLYRQALRDVPAQDGFPESVVWPVEPVSI